MLAHVEAGVLGLGFHAQADDRADDFQQDESDEPGSGGGEDDGDELIHKLPRASRERDDGVTFLEGRGDGRIDLGAGEEAEHEHPDDAAYRAAKRRWEAEHPIARGSVQDVVDHIDHIVKVAGIDHVGLGSDFDGVGTMPRQLDDVSTYPVITQELLNRGYAAEAIHKIMSGKVLRVLRNAGPPRP